MRKIAAAAATVTVTAAIITAAELSAATVQAAPPTSTSADSNRSRPHIHVLRFVDKVDPGSNTDIDLGKPGLSAGNQQVFRDSLYQSGRRIGYTAGVGQIVALTATTLTAQVVATATLPTGTLTYQTHSPRPSPRGPPPFSTLRSRAAPEPTATQAANADRNSSRTPTTATSPAPSTLTTRGPADPFVHDARASNTEPGKRRHGTRETKGLAPPRRRASCHSLRVLPPGL